MKIPIFNDTIKVKMLRLISENIKELYKNYLKVQAPHFDVCFVLKLNLRDLFGVGKSWKKVYSTTAAK